MKKLIRTLLPRTLLLSTFALVSLHASAQSARTWISGVGDDVNPCSRTAPCKTWAGAISKTAAHGEIDVLDEGGFGTVTITKSITLDGGPNSGGIAAGGTPGITINAASTDVITLRNVRIECLASNVTSCSNGVYVLSAKTVRLQNVDVGFFGNGINVASPTTLYADGVTIHDNTGNGVNFAPSSAAYASITHSLFKHNANGIVASDNAKITVTDSTAAGNSTSGFLVQSTAAAATLNVFNCNASGNTTAGLAATASGSTAATLRVSNVTTTSNGVGISSTGTAASVLSFKNNPLTGAYGTLGTLTLQ